MASVAPQERGTLRAGLCAGGSGFRGDRRRLRVDRDLGPRATGLQGSRREGSTTRATVTVAPPDLPVASSAVTDLPGCLQGVSTVLTETSLASHGTGTLGAARRALDGFRVHLGGTDGSPDHHHRQPAQQQIGQQDRHQDPGPKQRASHPGLGKSLQGDSILGQQSDGEVRRDILDQIGRPFLRRDVQRVAVHLHPLDLHVPNGLGESVKCPSLGGAGHGALTARKAGHQQHGHQHHRNHCGDQDRRGAQANPSSALLLAFSWQESLLPQCESRSVSAVPRPFRRSWRNFSCRGSEGG